MLYAKCGRLLHAIAQPVTDNNFQTNDRGWIMDWLVCNAGVAQVVALDWLTILYQFFTDPMMLSTIPRYLIELVGTETEDGMGLVFQANVFGHYYIVHPTRIV